MGGAQSNPTRKLSIPNEESNIIKVSESVAERLRKCTEKTPEDFMKGGKQPYKPSSGECPSPEADPFAGIKENVPHHPGDPLMNFYYGPSVTSLRILQEKEKELKDSEQYWSKRIENMEKHHEKMSRLLENEYNKAIEEISSQSPRPPPGTPFPCCREKKKLLECYKKNPKEILLCAGEVSEFSDCVHLNRIDKERAKENEKICKDDPENKNKKEKK